MSMNNNHLLNTSILINMQGLRIEAWEDFDNSPEEYSYGTNRHLEGSSILENHIIEYNNPLIPISSQQGTFHSSSGSPTSYLDHINGMDMTIETEIENMNTQLSRLAEARQELHTARQELIRLLTNQSLDFSDSSSGPENHANGNIALITVIDTEVSGNSMSFYMDANGVALSKVDEAMVMHYSIENGRFGPNTGFLDSNGDVHLIMIQSDVNR